jgi:hypothetical protein
MQTVYHYHKHQCKEEAFTLVRDIRYPGDISTNIERLEHCMNQRGSAGVIILNIVLKNPQNNYKDYIRALCVEGSSQLPNRLDYANPNALMISFSLSNILPSISLEKFSNLRSFILEYATFNDDIAAMFTELPLFKSMSEWLSNRQRSPIKNI